MKSILDIYNKKLVEVSLYLDDLIDEIEDPNWRKKHPLGPVHVKLICKCCDEVLAEDLSEFGWLHNKSFVSKYISPHLDKHR